MTDDPSAPSGRNHSDAASRLAALLAEIEGTGPPTEPVDETVEPVEPVDSSVEPVEPVEPRVEPVEPSGERVEPGPGLGLKGDHGSPGSEIVSVAHKERVGEPGPVSASPAPRVGRAGLVTLPTPGVSPKSDPDPATEVPRPATGGNKDRAPAVGEVRKADVSAASPAGATAVGPTAGSVTSELKKIEDGDDGPLEPAPLSGRRLRSKVAAAAFGFAIVVLAVSVPILGYVGSQSLLGSRGGKFQSTVNDSTAPGYLAVVEPTPTALVVQRDKDDAPVALTLLSLGNGDDGGSVLFIPLDTNLIQPAFLIDRLRTVYSNGLSKGNDAQFIRQVANLLNIGFTDVVDIHDDEWAQVVTPVAPIMIDNPADVQFGDPSAGGFDFPKGPLQLSPDEVGPYLSAQSPQQDDLDRLARHKLFWSAWLEGIADSVTADAVPNTLTGIGPYVGTLANGKVGIDTLAVFPSAQQVDGMPTFQVDSARMRTQVAEAVPAPVSPGLGGRYSVRLLNGVDGDPIPDRLTATLVGGGAQINTKGNAAAFGLETTRIEYHDVNREGTAIFVQRALGAGQVVADLSATDTVDLVITVGKDVLDR